MQSRLILTIASSGTQPIVNHRTKGALLSRLQTKQRVGWTNQGVTSFPRQPGQVSGVNDASSCDRETVSRDLASSIKGRSPERGSRRRVQLKFVTRRDSAETASPRCQAFPATFDTFLPRVGSLVISTGP